MQEKRQGTEVGPADHPFPPPNFGDYRFRQNLGVPINGADLRGGQLKALCLRQMLVIPDSLDSRAYGTGGIVLTGNIPFPAKGARDISIIIHTGRGFLPLIQSPANVSQFLAHAGDTVFDLGRPSSIAIAPGCPEHIAQLVFHLGRRQPQGQPRFEKRVL